MKLPALWFFYSLMRLQQLCLTVIMAFLSACQNPSLEGMLKLMKSNCQGVWLVRKTFFRLNPFITDLLFPPSGRNHVLRNNGRLDFKTLCDQLFGEVTFDHFFHQFLSRASTKEKNNTIHGTFLSGSSDSVLYRLFNYHEVYESSINRSNA